MFSFFCKCSLFSTCRPFLYYWLSRVAPLLFYKSCYCIQQPQFWVSNNESFWITLKQFSTMFYHSEQFLTTFPDFNDGHPTTTCRNVCVYPFTHLGWAHSLWRFLGPQLGLLFLVAQQLNTYFCVFVCVFSVFDMKCLSLWISKIF